MGDLEDRMPAGEERRKPETGTLFLAGSVFENQRRQKRRDMILSGTALGEGIVRKRLFHGDGAGAFGVFRPCQSMGACTRAEFLRDPETETAVFVRFSGGMGLCGGTGRVRDVRGFSVKFYTGQGNYDVTGLNLPVFFVRDPLKVQKLIQGGKTGAGFGLQGPEGIWDFYSRSPETMNLLLRLYSDDGAVRDYGEMDGHGVNTFVWVGEEGKRKYVKYHFLSRRRREKEEKSPSETGNFQASEADPGEAARRLYRRLESGDFPAYEFCIQMMDPERAEILEFDPLDPTKIWPEDRFPMIRAGTLTLNRNPEDFFSQVEQAAFQPDSLVPGIELSRDMTLQGRRFACEDAQRRRIGDHFRQLPVNASAALETENGAAGSEMGRNTAERAEPEYGIRPPLYCPNNLAEAPFPRETPGRKDDFSQAAVFYKTLSGEERGRLACAVASELSFCGGLIRERQLQLFGKTDPDLEMRVRSLLQSSIKM